MITPLTAELDKSHHTEWTGVGFFLPESVLFHTHNRTYCKAFFWPTLGPDITEYFYRELGVQNYIAKDRIFPSYCKRWWKYLGRLPIQQTTHLSFTADWALVDFRYGCYLQHLSEQLLQSFVERVCLKENPALLYSIMHYSGFINVLTHFLLQHFRITFTEHFCSKATIKVFFFLNSVLTSAVRSLTNY